MQTTGPPRPHHTTHMQNNTQAMHALLAAANINLATWVATGDADALQVGVNAAQALVADPTYATQVAHDLPRAATVFPFDADLTPVAAAWLRLAGLVTLTAEHQLELPSAQAIKAIPLLGRLEDASPMADDIAAYVAQLGDTAYLQAMRAHAAATPQRTA